MRSPSKRMKAMREAALKLGTAPLSVPDAVKALKGLETGLPANIKKSKFDQSVEIAIRLGVDPQRRAELRSVCSAPNVVDVAAARLARKINQMQRAALIHHGLRLQSIVRDAEQLHAAV